MKQVMRRIGTSINSKLIVPLLVSFIFALGGFYFVVDYSTETLVKEKLHSRAYELAESFAVATEVNTSHANFIRVINSIGAYEDIKVIFLLDDSRTEIIASSRNQYSGKPIRDVKDNTLRANLLVAVKSRRDFFWDNEFNEHLFAYKTQVISPDKSGLRRSTLLMKVDTSSSKQYIDKISFYYISTLFTILSILTIVQFVFVRKIVLRPIFKLVDSIKQTKCHNKPVVSEYESSDQLGVLTRVYNELILDSFEKQQELAIERENSIAASKAKSQFLAMMTHELRTPLNGVIGMSNKLNEQVTDPAHREYLRIIVSAANQLLSIINDTLDFSKIEANKLELDIQPFDLLESLTGVVNMFQMQVERKLVELSFNCPSSLPIIMGDNVRLIQVMINLIGNAIKFTERGSIVINLNVISQSDEQVDISITVRDTGIGMSEEQVDSLFKEFSQADSSTTRKYGGTGLGLWISKNLIEKMNGRIDIDSELGKGTTFTLYLTFDVSNQSIIEHKISSKITDVDIGALRNLDIMLVEDTEINQLVVMGILDHDNINFHVAQNGKEAVELFGTFECDLILMDCLMPIMDGFTASRKIREIEEIRSKEDGKTHRVPIIALTANALENTKQECLDSGMDEFITKPIMPEKLRESVARWAG